MNITEAQNKIATILKQLEIYTGRSVSRIDIESVSSMDWEGNPMNERTVIIELMSVAGSNWGQASSEDS